MDRVYRYEVELAVKDRDGSSGIVTRVERAYSVHDALLQAVHNHIAGNPGAEMKVLHIGPPTDAIAEAAQDIADACRRGMEASLLNSVGARGDGAGNVRRHLQHKDRTE